MAARFRTLGAGAVVASIAVLGTLTVASSAPVTGVDPPAPPVRPAPASTTTPAGPVVAPIPFSLSWTRPVVAGVNITQSSPVVVANGSAPFVVVGDTGGNLRAFDLATGTPRAGWSKVRTGHPVTAPLSSDGVNVYVPVALDNARNVPQDKKFNSSGGLVWSTNPKTVYPAEGGYRLSGLSLGLVGGTWQAFTGAGWYIHNFDGGTAAKRWSFRNLESTMSTPAVADLFGAGEPQVIVSTNKGPASPTTTVGGYLRIFAADGRRICSATQPAAGRTYRTSGYNNASPVVAEVGGQPLVMLGSTGPVQYGAGGNQILAYTASCDRKWASAPLAGPAVPSPSMADVLGLGTPQLVTMAGVATGADKYPRVYVLDPATGKTLVDTGTQLAAYKGNLAYPQSMSVVTADANADGYEDLFVPARNVVVVLSGRNRSILAVLPVSAGAGVLRNTPVITANPSGGIRVTMAGLSSNNGAGAAGGVVRSYVIPGGRLTSSSWPKFARNAQLNGQAGTLKPAYNQLLEGESLNPGKAIATPTGNYRLTMRTDGNLVVQNAQGTVTWATGTGVAGSHASLLRDGRLQVRTGAGAVVWTTSPTSTGVERAVIGSDGKVSIYSATDVKILEDITGRSRSIWHS